MYCFTAHPDMQLTLATETADKFCLQVHCHFKLKRPFILPSASASVQEPSMSALGKMVIEGWRLAYKVSYRNPATNENAVIDKASEATHCCHPELAIHGP